MMTYYFHEEAEKEFNQAIDYYEECQPHLGVEFAEEVFQTIQRILKFPDAWQTLHQDIRRCLTKRFPYWNHLLSQGKADRYFGSNAAESRTLLLGNKKMIPLLLKTIS